MVKLILVLALLCSQANALTLNQAVSKALNSNIDLLEIKQQAVLDKLEIKIQKQALLPFGTIKGLTKWHNHSSNTEDISIDIDWATQNGTKIAAHLQDGSKDNLTLTQPLLKGWNPKLNRANITKAIYNAQLTQLKHTELVNQIIKHTFELFYAVLLKSEELKLKTRGLDEAQKHWLTGQKQYQKGDLAKIEYLELKRYFLQSKLNLQQGQQALSKAKTSLSQYIHLPNKNITINHQLNIIDPKLLPKFNISTTSIIKQNPSIHKLKIALQQANLDLQKAQEDTAWDFNFQWKLENKGIQSAGLALELPLSNTKQKQAIKIQSLTIRKLQHQLDNLNLNLKQDIESLAQDIKDQFILINLSKLEVETTKLKHQASKIKFKNGDLSYSDLTKAYDKWLNSLLSLQSLQVMYMQKVLDYYLKINQLHHSWKAIAKISNSH